jgi:pyruvate/2-oxoglutarate dehydrogenase complex dihydrolipoamide acyltransferase (E2) component
MYELRLPKWGLTEEATVLEWLKQPGDQLSAGEAILIVETDKADGEVETPVAGVLEEICAPAGSTVEVEGVLARIRDS